MAILQKNKNEYFKTKVFINKRFYNYNLENVLRIIAENYGLINDDDTLQYRRIRNMIIKEGKDHLNVEISKKQVARTIRIKRKFPYKSLVILMAIYNLLKRCDEEIGNNREYFKRSQDSLIQYIRQTASSQLSYIHFCVLKSLSKKIYQHRQYKDNKGPYRTIYLRYLNLYETINIKFENTTISSICNPDDFCHYNKFVQEDIPKEMWIK